MTQSEEERNEGLDLRGSTLYALGAQSGRTFSRHGRDLPAAAALQDTALVGDLLKLGTVCLNLDRILSKEDGRAPTCADIPAILLGAGFSYAIDVAPLEGKGIEAEFDQKISVTGLRAHVKRIEDALGTIPVDPDLVARISALARDMSARPGAASKGMDA